MNRPIKVVSLIVRKAAPPLIATPSSLYLDFAISALLFPSFSPPFPVLSPDLFRAASAPYQRLVRDVFAPCLGPFLFPFPFPVVGVPAPALYLDLAPDSWVVQPREAFYPCDQNDLFDVFNCSGVFSRID